MLGRTGPPSVSLERTPKVRVHVRIEFREGDVEEGLRDINVLRLVIFSRD
jgi:hypothetical protein